MIIERGLERITCRSGSVVTVGAFDGVHRGHRAVLEQVNVQADRLEGPSTLVTFDPHPRQVLRNAPVARLASRSRQQQLLTDAGLQRLVVLPFTLAFSSMDATAFVRDVLVTGLGMAHIAVGPGHRFGHRAAGDAALLRNLGKEHGFGVHVLSAYTLQGNVVSSGQIRQLLSEAGQVRQAGAMLGRPYSLTATVIRGAQRGTQLGYPTANLVPEDPLMVVPAHGVYAVRVTMDGAICNGMMNIGVRPTVESGTRRHMEVHVFDFEGDLYGQCVCVQFIRRIRDEVRFENVDALRRQLGQDEERCRSLLEP